MASRVLLWVLVFFSAKEWAYSKVMSVKDLENEIATELTGTRACIRLLTVSRELGCGVPGDGRVSAPLQHMRSIGDTLEGDRVVLVSIDLAPQVLHGVLKDNVLRSHVKGVLITKAGEPSNFSTGSKFPSSDFPSPSFPVDKTYKWNPWGTGLRFKAFDLPIFLLSRSLSDDATRRAQKNAEQGFTGALNVAEMKLDMHGKANSTNCIQQKRCEPIGGHSMLAMFPDTKPTKDKPIVLVTAQVDTAALFLDRAVGADSRLSGLLVLLTAIHLLHEAGPFSDFPNRLVFTALTGEPWDYMGSRRLLWELGEGAKFIKGTIPLKMSRVKQVVELGSIGNPRLQNGIPKLYLHHDPNFSRPDRLVNAFKASSAELRGRKVTVESASQSTPGLPPSSLMTFLSEFPGIEGVVLTEYDAQFINPYFESHLDDETNINSSSIAAAAVLVAQVLNRLAFCRQDPSGSQRCEDPPSIVVDDSKAQNMTNMLVDCLVKSAPNLRCSLAQQLISLQSQSTTSTGQAEHYISTLSTLSEDPQDPDPNAKSNLERFIYNFLALESAIGEPVGDGCDNKGKKCNEGLVCTGYRFGVHGTEGLGKCLNSSIYFVPSYSLLLSCKKCSAVDYSTTRINRWEVASGEERSAVEGWLSARNWTQDPMWTESDWSQGEPSLQMFQMEERRTEVRILIAGVVMTLGSIVMAFVAQLVFDRHSKRS